MFHVLIIDDDLELREVMRKSLTRLGCEVSVAETAENGLDELREVNSMLYLLLFV